MNNVMKKTLICLCTASMLLSLAACGSTSAPSTPAATEAPAQETAAPAETETPAAEETEAPAAPDADTLGQKFLNVFNSTSSTEIEAIVDELVNSQDDYDLVPWAVEEGYLDGFDADITGFSEGMKFSPMIGSIPFVGYVLRSDDAQALLDLMKDNANPAWNICTEADETVYAVNGDLVFFLMCSNEEF